MHYNKSRIDSRFEEIEMSESSTTPAQTPATPADSDDNQQTPAEVNPNDTAIGFLAQIANIAGQSTRR